MLYLRAIQPQNTENYLTRNVGMNGIIVLL